MPRGKRDTGVVSSRWTAPLLDNQDTVLIPCSLLAAATSAYIACATRRQGRFSFASWVSLSQVSKDHARKSVEGLRMRTRLLLAAVVFSLLGSARVRADHLKDPAEVLPAKTVVYGELRQPGQLVKEIGSLLEGSALENVPD